MVEQVQVVLGKAKVGEVWPSLLSQTRPLSDIELAKIESDLELERLREAQPSLFINHDEDFNGVEHALSQKPLD